MPHNRPLILKVAGKNDFLVPGLVVSVLILVSALLSTQPVSMTAFVIALLGAGWFLFILDFSKVAAMKLTSVIFPDGLLSLESTQETKIEGVLSGQQWCNSQLAVLRYITSGRRQYLVILSAQQNADDYRRLMVWLRQNFVINNKGRVQS